MKIKKLRISGIGGIKELECSFQDNFNVLCGANGVGKTTILNIIVDGFSGGASILKRNRNYEVGNYEINFIDNSEKEYNKTFLVKEFDPDKQETRIVANDFSSYIMLFNINRIIDYAKQDSIPRDPVINKHMIARNINKGVSLNDFKGFFINRYLFADKDGSLTNEQRANFAVAKEAFTLMDNKIKFKSVDAASLDIKLDTLNGEIYFEYLSAGYKTCLYIILGIIKEIEFRFKEPCLKVADFNGVILIDEIDLHLHPTWQSKLVEVLRRTFPNAQFIVTTYSPNVLQGLEEKQIIPLTMDNNGNVKIKELHLGTYGLQGWTIEEILINAMEMENAKSNLYSEILKKFELSLNNDNKQEVKKYYDILMNMLNPDSIIREIIKIQIVGMGINDDKIDKARKTKSVD